MEYCHLTRELRDILRSEEEAYIPGLNLEPVPVRPDEIMGIIDAWPDYRGLMRS